jgi:hypothetical protein
VPATIRADRCGSAGPPGPEGRLYTPVLHNKDGRAVGSLASDVEVLVAESQLRLSPDLLWFGADVRVESSPVARPTDIGALTNGIVRTGRQRQR